MVNIQISLPDDKLELLERERESTGETQSEVIARALDILAQQNREAGDTARDIGGYEEYPETEEELAGFMTAQLEVLTEYPWEHEEVV